MTPCTCDGAPHRLVCARVMGAPGDTMTLYDHADALISSIAARLDAERTYAAAARAHAGAPTPDYWHVLGRAAVAVRWATEAERAAQREYDRAYRAACLPEVGR